MVRHAVEFGVVLSAIVFPLLLVAMWPNPEIMLNDYPPDVKAKWGPMSERTKRQRAPVALGLLVVGVAIVAWSLQTLPAAITRDLTFTSAFAYFAVMFMTANVLDCFVVDWALVYVQPKFFILPGTEGMSGYRDYWFHVLGFFIGVPIVLAISAIAAAIVMYTR